MANVVCEISVTQAPLAARVSDIAGAGEAIRTLPVFTYQRSFTYYQAGMGAALSNMMLALLLMAVTIYFVAFPPEADETDG